MELHLYEFAPESPQPRLKLPDGVFEMKTCQRTLILSSTPLGILTYRCYFHGLDAYDFLLKFACGLESEIKGETDVFGQIKIAYKNFTLAEPAQAILFQSLFLKLFEDTKEIRAEFLQGVGGNSYGALARRLLCPTPRDKVLLLGAGQISKSIAPYFAESELSIFNRSSGRLNELEKDLAKKGYLALGYLQTDEELEAALLKADLILLGTPAKSELDQKVISVCLKQNSVAKILHLGAQAVELHHFEVEPLLGKRFFSLSDLFAMEKNQNIFRDKQVSQAMEACRHRAILRSMARSIHISHGWEDLALFS